MINNLKFDDTEIDKKQKNLRVAVVMMASTIEDAYLFHFDIHFTTMDKNDEVTQGIYYSSTTNKTNII
jgi:hypothetical protein